MFFEGSVLLMRGTLFHHHPLSAFPRVTASFFILACKVVGFNPSSAAAPLGPLTRPSAWRSASTIAARSVSARVVGTGMAGACSAAGFGGAAAGGAA
jgi:hypothetical protein